MLTLTRKSGECIRIGDDIRIVVREIKGRQVRLGVEAPLSVPVYREELFLKIQGESEEEAPALELELECEAAVGR